MHNLVSLKPKQVLHHISPDDYRAYCGFFTSPRNASKPDEALALGAVWAADNDCFMEYNPDRIRGWLTRWKSYAPTCKFFNCPDVIKDAAGTLERFALWRGEIKSAGWRIAFTMQNGMESYAVPFDEIDALFIGSSDDFKYSDYMKGVVTEAKRRGLWVHNGRVNSIAQIRATRALGCDSFDGTGYVRDAAKVALHLPYLKVNQLSLF